MEYDDVFAKVRRKTEFRLHFNPVYGMGKQMALDSDDEGNDET